MNIRDHLDGLWRDRKISYIRFLVSLITILLTLLAVFIVIAVDIESWLPESLTDSGFSSAIFISALLAVFLHNLFDFIANWFMPQSLDEIPEDIRQEAMRVVVGDIGFYRKNTELSIDLIHEVGGGSKLVLNFTSSILRAGKSSSNINIKYYAGPIKVGNAEASPTELYYKIGTTGNTIYREKYKNEINISDDIHIDKIQDEQLKICYDMGGSNVSCITDEHTWESPISGGFSVRFNLSGYNCDATTSRGTKFRRRSYSKPVILYHPGALLANQGFSWSIQKIP